MVQGLEAFCYSLVSDFFLPPGEIWKEIEHKIICEGVIGRGYQQIATVLAVNLTCQYLAWSPGAEKTKECLVSFVRACA